MNNKVPASDCRTGTSVGKSRILGTYPVVEVRGFEPLASSMRPKRSSQLSYTPEGIVTIPQGRGLAPTDPQSRSS